MIKTTWLGRRKYCSVLVSLLVCHGTETICPFVWYIHPPHLFPFEDFLAYYTMLSWSWCLNIFVDGFTVELVECPVHLVQTPKGTKCACMKCWGAWQSIDIWLGMGPDSVFTHRACFSYTIQPENYGHKSSDYGPYFPTFFVSKWLMETTRADITEAAGEKQHVEAEYVHI